MSVCLCDSNSFFFTIIGLHFFEAFSAASVRMRFISGVDVASMAFPRLRPAAFADLGGACETQSNNQTQLTGKLT